MCSTSRKWHLLPVRSFIWLCSNTAAVFTACASPVNRRSACVNPSQPNVSVRVQYFLALVSAIILVLSRRMNGVVEDRAYYTMRFLSDLSWTAATYFAANIPQTLIAEGGRMQIIEYAIAAALGA